MEFVILEICNFKNDNEHSCAEIVLLDARETFFVQQRITFVVVNEGLLGGISFEQYLRISLVRFFSKKLAFNTEISV